MADEPDLTLVHAKYLGDSPVVMPRLAGRDRCCRKENQRPAEAPEGETLKPHTLLEHGDVVLLDRYSAEGRDDFELVTEDEKAKPKKPASSPPEAD